MAFPDWLPDIAVISETISIRMINFLWRPPGRPRGAAGFEGGHASHRKVRGAERSG